MPARWAWGRSRRTESEVKSLEFGHYWEASGDRIGWNETRNSERPKCEDGQGQWPTKVGLVIPEMGR